MTVNGEDRTPMRSMSGSFTLPAALAVAMILWALQAAAEARVIELAIRHGILPENQRVIHVRQGDEVTLRWTTDKALTVHLHGYDLEEHLSPDVQAVMRFTARATGRFPIEVHGSRQGEEVTLGYLEVYPR